MERQQKSGFLVRSEVCEFQLHPYYSHVGTGIGAYGTIGPKYSGQDPISLYTLDNNSPTTYHGKAEANSQYRTLFFQSPELRSGIHELTVTNGAEGVVFFLDYFLVNLDTTASLSSFHHQLKTADLLTLTVTQDNLPTGVTGSVHSAVKGIRRTALVGALTGLIILAFVMLGCFLNAPRRRRLVEKNHTYRGPGCKLLFNSLFFTALLTLSQRGVVKKWTVHYCMLHLSR